MHKKKALKWISSQHKSLVKHLIILIVLALIMSLSAIFFAYYSKSAIDEAIISTGQQFIFYAVLIGVIMLINIITTTISQYLKAYYKSQTDQKLKSKLFEHLMHADLQEVGNTHSGEHMTKLISDVDVVADGVIEILPRFSFYVTRFIGAFILIFFIDYLFAVIFLVLGLILMIMSRLIAGVVRKRHLTLQQEESVARSFMQETIENVMVIKSYQAESHVSNDHALKQSAVFKAKVNRNKINVFISSGMHIFFSFGYLFAIVFGAYRLQLGLTIGGLIALIQLVGHVQTPFSGMAQLIPMYHQTLASAQRLMTMDSYQVEDQKQNQTIDSFECLEVHNLTFKYGQKNVIDNFSFEVKQGEFIHLKGESGRGKTTLFKLILALIEPLSGNILVFFNQHNQMVSKETRSLFSYVPQGNLILSGTIRDNLLFYKIASDEQIYKALKVVNLYDDVIGLQNQLDTPLKEKGSGLSEGQLQRLAIARALIKDAPILLLDEITSALDQETELKVLYNLKKMTNKTIIMSSHRTLDPLLIDREIELLSMIDVDSSKTIK